MRAATRAISTGILADGGQADIAGVETIVVADQRDVAGHGESIALQLEHKRQSNAILLACDGGGHLVLAYELVDHVADFITSIVIDLADDNLRLDAFPAAAGGE